MNALDPFSATAPLVLVGTGKMGGALLKGWLDRGLDPRAVVAVDPAPSDDAYRLLSAHGIAAAATPPPGAQARAIVIAVKPQVIAAVLPPLRSIATDATLAISIAAGTTVATLREGLGDIGIVRAMPNTPAQVGRGITGAIANPGVDAPRRALADALLSAVGEVVWLDEERLLDAVTAVSGSGPAYVFLLAECLEQAAVEAGLPADIAAHLARATVTGSAELLRQSDLPPAVLRQNVTSPNGTTAAALSVLMAPDGLGLLMERAVAAARLRSEELAG
jgi:pyrroline-5-carboxylate reductase